MLRRRVPLCFAIFLMFLTVVLSGFAQKWDRYFSQPGASTDQGSAVANRAARLQRSQAAGNITRSGAVAQSPAATANLVTGTSLDVSEIFLEGRLFGSGGNGVTNLAAADLNSDGKLDLVVANNCVSGSVCGGNVAGSVGVLLGNGDGTYQPAVIYYTYSSEVYSVTVADVNGDGKPDVLVGGACPGGNCLLGATVTVLLGNGDGTFHLGGTYSASSAGAGELAVADVNGDGKADVVTVGGEVGVLLGNGDGTFQPVVVYNPGGNYADSVAIADVNGDGKLDLVVGNEFMSQGTPIGGVGVLLGNGDGTFQTAAIYSSAGEYAYSVAVADLNGDGHPDIVVTNQYAGNGNLSDGSVSVLLGNGDGSFQPAVSYNPGGNDSYSVAIADLNGDGKPDLVTANACEGKGNSSNCNNNSLGVLLGNGDGTFQRARSYATGGSFAFSIVLADVNGDSKADVLLTDQYPGNGPGAVSVIFGNGDGSFRAPLIYPSGGYNDNMIAAADVNGDGKLDLVIASQGVSCTGCVGGVSVLLGNGNGTFQSQVSYGTGTANPTYSVAVADVNGDGKPDIVAASSCISNINCVSSVAVLLNNGDGTFKTAVNYASNGQAAHSVAIGDVNGDGKADIVVANSCATGDFYCTSGTVGMLLGNGDGTFRPVVIYSTGGAYPTSVVVGDLNNDGRADIVVSNYQTTTSDYTGRIGVLLGNGDGTFQPAVTYASGGVGDNSVAVVDLNGDGKLDLLAVNQGATVGPSNGTVGVLLGNGDGTFQPVMANPTTGVSVDYFAQVAIGDFNGDGRLDVACGAGDFLLLGNGDGTFQAPQSLGFEGTGIATGDFNGDGRPDLAVGGVAVLLNIGQGFRENDTIAVVSSKNPAAYQQNLTFTATVTPQGSGTPTGTVSFKDGATNLGSASLTSGSAALTTAALGVGTHSITASYSGDSNFLVSTSATLTQTVSQPTTTTTLASTANPSYLNQSVTFTATVTSSYGGAVAGNVTFKQASTVLGTVALLNGQAAYSATYTTSGTRYVTAVYSGDSNHLGSTSAVLSQVVSTLPAATTTKVSTSGSPTFINQLVMFTAKITSTYGPIPDGDTVTFYDGTTVMGAGLTSNGATTFSTPKLAARTRTIKASYAGDVTFKSSSGTVTQVVNLYPSSITVPTSSRNPSIYGQSVTLSATVTSTAPSSPTGTVVFKNGTTSVGSATANASGVATLTKSNLAAGTLSITATYNGDSETAKSTSAALLQTVKQATSATAAKSSLNPSLSGQTVTFTVTVTSPTTTPTGTVTFNDANNTLGTGTLSGGKASYNTTTLSTSSHIISAIYNGTANIKGSTSATVVQNVN
jgi:Bacterial Ig-like domain (group 3)/FG-GAP-like repeat/FG-GAP repeat